MSRLHLALLAVAGMGLSCLPQTAEAGFRAFLEIRTADTSAGGYSTDPVYTGWMEVQSFGQGLENGAEAGAKENAPTQLGSLALQKKVDATSAALAEFLFRGEQGLSVHLVLASDQPGRIELWDIRCLPAAVSSQTFAANSEDLVETLTITAGAIEVSYIEVDPGNGAAVREIFASFDAQTLVSGSGTRAPGFPGDPDTDQDGIPDSVERYYGLDPFTANGNVDTDGDGLTNLQEYLAGTDPTKANNVLKVTQVQVNGGVTNLTWTGQSGKRYVIESSPNLTGPFTEVGAVLSTGTGPQTMSVPNPSPARSFFRVRVQP